MGSTRSKKRPVSPRPSEISKGHTAADDARVLARMNADLGLAARFSQMAETGVQLLDRRSHQQRKDVEAVQQRVTRIENSRRIDTLAIALAASALIVACAGWFM